MGSARQVVNIATGAVAGFESYDEFGRVQQDDGMSETPGAAHPFGFAGGLDMFSFAMPGVFNDDLKSVIPACPQGMAMSQAQPTREDPPAAPPFAQDGSLGGRVALRSSAAMFAAALMLFWWNAAPSVTFHDSAEFAMAAASAGVPHPPGAPTWTILASAFLRLGQFTDPARGTNLFSGLWGAITLGLVCLLAQMWTRRLYPGLNRAGHLAAGVGAALILLGSRAFVEQSLVTEQYTLLTAFIMLPLIVMTSLADTGALPADDARANARRRWLALALGATWGLAIGNHPSQVAMGLSVFVALLAAARSGQRWGDLWRLGLWTAGGLVLALQVFWWVPLRSWTNPLMDWGNVKTWDRFMFAIQRKQWEPEKMAPFSWPFAIEWLKSYRFLSELGAVGVAGAWIGMAVLWRRQRWWLGLLLAIGVPYAAGMLLAHIHQGFKISYIRQYGLSDWHLPLYMLGAISGGIALGAWGAYLGRTQRRPLAAVLTLLVLTALVVQAVWALEDQSQRHATDAEDFLHALLAPLPADALMAVSSDNPTGLLIYDRWIRHPESHRWVAIDMIHFCHSLSQKIQSPEGWTMDWRILFVTQGLCSPNQQPLRVPIPSPEDIRRRPLLIEYTVNSPKACLYLEPCGLFYRVLDRPIGNDEAMAAEVRWRAAWPDLLRTYPPEASPHVREAWFDILNQRAAYFCDRGLYREAVEYYARSTAMIQTNGEAWFAYGYSLEAINRVKEAANAYQNAIATQPDLPGPRLNLAVLLASNGHLDLAARLLREELTIDPQSHEAEVNLQLVERNRATHKPQRKTGENRENRTGKIGGNRDSHHE